MAIIFRFTGETKNVYNFTSYNYLGMASDQSCIDKVETTVEKYGVASCSPSRELG